MKHILKKEIIYLAMSQSDSNYFVLVVFMRICLVVECLILFSSFKDAYGKTICSVCTPPVIRVHCLQVAVAALGSSSNRNARIVLDPATTMKFPNINFQRGRRLPVIDYRILFGEGFF
jgi:hypothetical protein